jgi:uncharacterized caspase-like protein
MKMRRFAVVVFLCLVIASASAQEQKGDLWILAVGVNEYPQNQLYSSLGFCVSDAKNIRDVFKAQENKAFNKVNTLLIADTEAVKPTKNNIISNMSFFRNAKPNDTVILFFSSHSMLEGNGAFYLMPSDSRFDASGKPAPASMINFTDIVQSFTMPGKKIIILDTYYSETAIKLVTGRNIAVFGACRDDQQAYESDQYGGGFFTSSIVNAFNGDAFTDGIITLESLFLYVVNRVRDITRRAVYRNRQTPVLYIPDGMSDPVLGRQ